MDKEIWKVVEGFPDYSVSNLGRVISRKTSDNKFIGSKNKQTGYIQVALYNDSTIYKGTIHKLVAKEFVPNPSNLPEVNHLDEDTSNNQADNLEWCSKSYNINYGNRNSLVSEKLINGATSKEVEGFDPITLRVICRFPSIKEAQRSGFNHGAISNCCRGVRNTHKARGSCRAHLLERTWESRPSRYGE